MSHKLQLVLASTSPYRKALLDQLQLEFSCARPEVDETPQKGETVEQLVVRLAESKARAVEKDFPHALIIGSDQSAVLNHTILTKPGNRENAIAQLRAASGQRITFQTGLCLLNSETGKAQNVCVPFTVVFRHLSDEVIEHYLEKEQPYNCVGSFKSEGLGVALFERFEGDDPNALIGLPLIQLNGLLRNEGFEILA
jgi:MAF protein